MAFADELRMRAELALLVEQLLEGTVPGDAVSLDAIGEAIGARRISQDEIDEILETIEARGRVAAAPAGGHGEERLKRALAAARILRAELSRPPSVDQIAERAGLTRAEVEHALTLAKIMQR
jgi:2-hydroxychromene-2-carboxylate isomerase